MKKLVLSASVLAAALSFSPVLTMSAAHADGPSVAGFTCGFVTVTDPRGQGLQTGEVDSHFVTWDDNIDSITTDPPAVNTDPSWTPAEFVSSGNIKCIFRAGAGNNTYASGGIIATAASAQQTGYVDLTQTVSYPQQATGVPIFVCTVWEVTDGLGGAANTSTYYADDSTGELSTNAATSTCAEATSQDTGPIDGLVCDTIIGSVPDASVQATLRGAWGCPA